MNLRFLQMRQLHKLAQTRVGACKAQWKYPLVTWEDTFLKKLNNFYYCISINYHPDCAQFFLHLNLVLCSIDAQHGPV